MGYLAYWEGMAVNDEQITFSGSGRYLSIALGVDSYRDGIDLYQSELKRDHF